MTLDLEPSLLKFLEIIPAGEVILFLLSVALNGLKYKDAMRPVVDHYIM